MFTGKFEDDLPLDCNSCGKVVYPGDWYFKQGSNNYCSINCIQDENADATQEYLMKAEDYFMRFKE